MAISRQDFFNEKAIGALWDVGVSIKRSNPLPIDADSVFASYAEAETYAGGTRAYPSQIVGVVNEDSVEIYYLDQNCALQPIGGKVESDGKTITVGADGKLSLVGFDSAQEGYQIKVINAGTTDQPNLQLAFFEPDTTTVEGLSTTVDTHTSQISQLQTDVAAAATEVDELAENLANNYYDKTAVDGLVSGAFHFKGTAQKFEEGNIYIDDEVLTTMKNGDVYQVGDIEYAYDGTQWVELGFAVDLSNYALKTDVSTAKSEAIASAAETAQEKADAALADAKSYTEEQVAAHETSVAAALASQKTDIEAEIATAKSEAITAAGTNADAKIATAKTEMESYTDTKVGAVDSKVAAVEASIENLGALASKDQVGEAELADALKSKIDSKANAATTLEGYGIADAMTATEITDAISAAKSEAVATAGTNADTKIAGMANTDTAVAGQYVSAVAQTDGKITVTRADLPDYSNTYDAKGSASAVKNELIGANGDSSAADTIYGAKAYADEKVATKVASVAAGDTSVTIAGTATAPTVAVKIDPVEGNAIALSDAGLKVTIPEVVIPTYTISKKETAEDGYFASYELLKDSVAVGSTINIPKDYLVKSAEIKESIGEDDPSGFAAGVKYIDFVVNTQSEDGNESHIYLNVQELVDAYTSGNGITISDTNEVSAKVVAGNGLSVDADGIKMALATEDTAGAMTSAEKASIADSATKVTTLETAVQDINNELDGLSAIAMSGNVNDLIQTEGDVIILDCGGAN